VRVLRAAEYRRITWKNGRGVSSEIAVSPPGADYSALDWQVSRTEIAADTRFSLLSELDRQIMLVSGAGIELRCGNGMPAIDFVHRIDRPLEPFAFRGDWNTDCRLLGGAAEVLNVITRRGRAAANIEVRELQSMTTVAKPGREQLVAWVARGSLDAYGGWGHARLEVNDSVLIEEVGASEIAVTPAASKTVVVLIRLDQLT
jgi:uncharacterized protein